MEMGDALFGKDAEWLATSLKDLADELDTVRRVLKVCKVEGPMADGIDRTLARVAGEK